LKKGLLEGLTSTPHEEIRRYYVEMMQTLQEERDLE
jgi:hypothetical protein